MFKSFRNRLLFLLMATILCLTAVFFSAILILSQQNVERRSTEVLEQALMEQRLPIITSGPERFAALFSIDLDVNGKTKNFKSNFEMQEPMVKALVASALGQQRRAGKVVYEDLVFKFRVKEQSEDLQKLVFMDVSGDAEAGKAIVYSLFMSALPLLIMIFLMSRHFAERAIFSIRESFKKQEQFIADASHEFKTPLASIQANVSLLQSGASSEQQKWLGFIKDETQRLDKLSSQLLYLTRGNTSDQKLLRCDLSEKLATLIMPMEAMFFEKGIRTEISVEENLWVMAVAEQLERILNILIENAVKYCATYVKIDLSKQGRRIVLSVSNDGLGIQPEDLDKIWDRFYRTDKSRQNIGGWGLGLAMAKSIANELHAVLKVSSQPTVETKFTLSFPGI